jgi:hypothetical protein
MFHGTSTKSRTIEKNKNSHVNGGINPIQSSITYKMTTFEVIVPKMESSSINVALVRA